MSLKDWADGEVERRLRKVATHFDEVQIKYFAGAKPPYWAIHGRTSFVHFEGQGSTFLSALEDVMRGVVDPPR